VAGTWCIGNAFLWWATVPALLVAAWTAWRERAASPATSRSLAFVALLGLGQWALWGVKARSLNFMHYMFESIPFVCLALVYLLVRVWDASATSRWEAAAAATTEGDETDLPDPPALDARRAFVLFYAALVIGWFVFYYPLLSALPMPERLFKAHLWLDRPWI
jgi:dolichyl-phosphate-mannose--protein O-mannosyl transferase